MDSGLVRVRKARAKRSCCGSKHQLAQFDRVIGADTGPRVSKSLISDITTVKE